MEKVPSIAYLNVVMQAVGLAFGLFLAGTALPNMENPNFNVRRHSYVGRLYLVLVLACAVVGKLVDASLPAGTLNIPGDTFLTIGIVILATVGAVFGIEGGRVRLRTTTGMMRAHPWFLFLSVALLLAQGWMHIGNRGLKLIKF